MDPTEPYTSISVLLGDESTSFNGNVGGSIPPATQNGNIYSIPVDEEEGEDFGDY